jgi:integrase
MAMSKRANGEGSIRHDKERKRWEGRVTVRLDGDGKPIRKKVTGRTRAEVRKRMQEVTDAAEEGRETLSRTLTVGRFLDDWLDNVLPGTVSHATEAQYRQIARLYVVPHVGRKHLKTLQPRDVTLMLRSMAADGLSTNSQRLARAVLRRSLRWAEVNGYVTRNVAALADAPKVQSTEGKALSEEQARTLLNAAKDKRLEAAFTVALSLGLRRSELLGLSWDDINLDATPPRLTVRRALKRTPNGLVLEQPKTRQSRRTIHLPAPVVASLRRHRVQQAEERLAAGDLYGGAPDDADLIFRTEIGTAIDPNNFGRAVRNLCRDAGLPGTWSPHALRHSAASLLLAQGVPLKVISEVLGHSSIRVTADIYAHIIEPAKTEAADAMASALWG